MNARQFPDIDPSPGARHFKVLAALVSQAATRPVASTSWLLETAQRLQHELGLDLVLLEVRGPAGRIEQVLQAADGRRAPDEAQALVAAVRDRHPALTSPLLLSGLPSLPPGLQVLALSRQVDQTEATVVLGSHQAAFPTPSDAALLEPLANLIVLGTSQAPQVTEAAGSDQALQAALRREQLANQQLTERMASSTRRERLYETILSHSPDLVYVFDTEHRFIYANAVLLQMWGKTWDEAIGKTCLELGYEPWHAAMHGREIEQVKATRQSIRGDVPFDGTFGRRIYDYIFVPILGPDGEVEAVGGTTRDVTERHQAAEALREQDQRKDEFLATLAHELRNPLAPVRNGLEILRRTGELGEKASRTREMMARQVGHMARLIDDLMDVSRVSRGEVALQPECLPVARIIEAAIDTSRPLIEASRHTLQVVHPDTTLQVEGDLTRLAQVLSNLLNNAAKYTPEGGLIVLSVAQDGAHEVLISVQDNGVGIPPDMLPRVFEMFTQVGSALTHAQGGLGIGLSLARKLVEMHGGRLDAESAGLGQGARFSVRLPLAGVDTPLSP